MKNSLLLIARQAIYDNISGRGSYSPPSATGGNVAQGCFVSLKKESKLRGCMGTMAPTQSTLEAEVAANALAAALRDPRFQPVRLEELDLIQISIDLLSPLEEVQSEVELDPVVYGLMVRAGRKKGLLLPDLPGVRTVRRQIEICREKAGIPAGEPVTMERFVVERIEE